MTKEELEKATGYELIEQRNYCGVDGYYGDYLDDVNAEMLKRFNRLTELEIYNEKLLDGDIKKHNKIVELESQIEKMKNELHQRVTSQYKCDSDLLDKIVGLDRLWQFGQEF